MPSACGRNAAGVEPNCRVNASDDSRYIVDLCNLYFCTQAFTDHTTLLSMMKSVQYCVSILERYREGYSQTARSMLAQGDRQCCIFYPRSQRY